MKNANWQQQYRAKVASPEQAVKAIKAGRKIFVGSGAAAPQVLVNALVEHGHHLADNEIAHIMTLGPAPYVAPNMAGRFRHTAYFIGENVREAVQSGRADYAPVFLSELPDLIRTGGVKVDVALVQVSEPDAFGYVSLGVSVDVVRAAVDAAQLILAEVNPAMPRTLGDSMLEVSRIAMLVPVDYPLPERISQKHDEVDRELGRHVASLVPDGATLQTGIGNVPDAILAALGRHRDLGVHTEMLSDGLMRLAQAGVINGRRKTLLPGKIVTSFVMGSSDLYAWVNDNPAVEMRPSSFTNDVVNVGRNDRMVAINAAIAVDLTGQVAADTRDGKLFSGIGGQVDFIRGAGRSRGGRAIIALRSTGEGGVSRIVAALDPGTGVVTTRGDVHFVVTEYGVAELWGKSLRQRAMALIEIAHPDHRAELLSAAKERRFVFADQIAPRAPYPWAEARPEKLPSGEQLLVRPVRVTDEQPLQDLFYRLSDESKYTRFFGIKREHPHREMQKMVDLDYRDSMAMLAVSPEGEVIGLARYDLEPGTGLADIAFVVRDDWQGKGVGATLMRRMKEIAQAQGLDGFSADVLAGNRAMLSVFARSGLEVTDSVDSGVHHLVARFPSRKAPGCAEE